MRFWRDLLRKLLFVLAKILERTAYRVFHPVAIIHKTHLSYWQCWVLTYKSRFTILPAFVALPKYRARILISGWGWSELYDNRWRQYAADAMETGSKLIAVQHGGGYGMRAFSQCELDQKRVTDEFWGWGWAEHNVTLPPIKVKRKPQNILFISGGRMTPICRLDSEPLFDHEWKQHFDWQERFFDHLGHDRESVLYRRYPEDCSRLGEGQIIRRFPDLKIDQSRNIPWDKAWLVIIDHCATSMLYALALNIPTILFWNPLTWGIRESAIPYLAALKDIGVYYDDPVRAANKARSFTEEWWQSRRVQTVREIFVKHFAWTEKNWTQSWIENVKRISSS